LLFGAEFRVNWGAAGRSGDERLRGWMSALGEVKERLRAGLSALGGVNERLRARGSGTSCERIRRALHISPGRTRLVRQTRSISGC
jgi:hypothetical protein